MSSNQVKYFELLARYYVLKRQHMLAAHALLRLAGRPSTDGVPTLEQRSISQFPCHFFCISLEASGFLNSLSLNCFKSHQDRSH